MSDEQAIMTARELTQALNKLGERLEATRRITWRTVVVVAIDVILTVVVAVTAVQANNASHAAAHAQSAGRALCLAGNTARREQLDIWSFFLQLVGPPKTPADAHAEALLRARLATDLTPRDCATLGGHK